MSNAPSALLVGQAEIDRVARLLGHLGVDFERVPDPRPGMQLLAPSRLLVVSGACVPRMPELKPAAPDAPEPIRVCIHSQDFLPLRDRLRKQGFHYLVQSALDESSLRVFCTQLVHPSAGQRKSPRLPLGVRIDYRSTDVAGTARLADLTAESCRIVGIEGLHLDNPVAILLPAVLGGGAPLTLHGHVMRRDGGDSEPAAVIRFGVLDADARQRLERIINGELIGTRVTPLSDELPTPPESSARSAEPPAPDGPPEERRREVRHPYHGRVDVLELPGDADGALGCDLSLDGVCITGGRALKPGMKVTLALYGGHGNEPTVVEAEVLRTSEQQSALVFADLSDAQQDRLAELIAQQPALQALEPSGETGRLLATEILDRST